MGTRMSIPPATAPFTVTEHKINNRLMGWSYAFDLNINCTFDRTYRKSAIFNYDAKADVLCRLPLPRCARSLPLARATAKIFRTPHAFSPSSTHVSVVLKQGFPMSLAGLNLTAESQPLRVRVQSQCPDTQA